MKQTVLATLIILFLSCITDLKASEKLSNGLIELSVNAQTGTYEVIDLINNRVIVSQAFTGFSIKPYLELWEVGSDKVETDQAVTSFNSLTAQNSTTVSSRLKGSFPDGKSISLISRIEGAGELEVQFSLYRDSTFLEIGFSFRNQGKEPVRLERVDVLNGLFMEGLDRDYLQTLNGNSGGVKTEVLHGYAREAENNILCFFAGPGKQQSLVAGGLTYKDYRKYMHVNLDSLAMYAYDPVAVRLVPDCYEQNNQQG